MDRIEEVKTSVQSGKTKRIAGRVQDALDDGDSAPDILFIEAAKQNADVKLVACSGLLTTTMPAMKETVAAIKASGLNGIKVMVGGAPVTRKFAEEIGADGYAPDAGGAVIKAKALMSAA
jgi:methanogenic corrinoid protein MtbC1